MTEHLFVFAILIAFIGVGIAGISLVLNLVLSKTQRLASESQFVSDIQQQFDKVGDKILYAKTKKDCLDYVWQHLNTADRLCFFETKKRLHDDIIEYFTNYLETSLRYLTWVTEINYMDEENLLKGFPYIKKTCNKFSITPNNRKMDMIKKYPKLPLG